MIDPIFLDLEWERSIINYIQIDGIILIQRNSNWPSFKLLCTI